MDRPQNLTERVVTSDNRWRAIPASLALPLGRTPLLMAQRRVGLWFIGACGGVAGTTALGLSALARGLTPTTGLVTALPQFANCAFDEPSSFVVGGHEVRQATILSAARELHGQSGVFDERTLATCANDLEQWSNNIRPGVVFRPNSPITKLADRLDVRSARTPREAIDAIQNDLRDFKSTHKLEQVVVVNAHPRSRRSISPGNSSRSTVCRPLLAARLPHRYPQAVSTHSPRSTPVSPT